MSLSRHPWAGLVAGVILAASLVGAPSAYAWDAVYQNGYVEVQRFPSDPTGTLKTVKVYDRYSSGDIHAAGSYGRETTYFHSVAQGSYLFVAEGPHVLVQADSYMFCTQDLTPPASGSGSSLPNPLPVTLDGQVVDVAVVATVESSAATATQPVSIEGTIPVSVSGIGGLDSYDLNVVIVVLSILSGAVLLYVLTR